MALDAVLESLGRWGRWQLMTYFLITFCFCVPSTWQLFAIVFIGVVTPHSCRAGPNQTLTESVPLEYDVTTDTHVYSACHQYVDLAVDNRTEPCTRGWHYDPLYFTPETGTIAMEWDLVCDKASYVATSQTIFSVGVASGALLCAPLSDYFGRKWVFFICQALMSVLGLAMAFSPSYAVFCVFQFLTGVVSQGLFMTGYVMACELFPSRARAVMAQSAYFFFALGSATLALLAFLLRDWRSLQIAISVPFLASLIYWKWCPESLRWLAAKGKYEAVRAILVKAATFNHVTLPPDVLSDLTDDTEGNPDAVTVSIWNMLKSPRPRRYMLIMLFLMFANNLMYFGLSLMTSSLTGNLYILFFINALLEVPGTLFAIVFSTFFGRRWPLFGFHVFAGIFMLLSAAATSYTSVSNGTTVTAFALISKFGVSGAWCIELIYAQEIYPTVVRGTGLGLSAGLGFTGAIVAPYTAFVFLLYDWVPGTVFGILSLTAAALTPLCPETHGRSLPSTIEEIANWSLSLSSEEKEMLKTRAGRLVDNKVAPVKSVAEHVELPVSESNRL